MNYTRFASLLLTIAILTAGCVKEASGDQNGPSALPLTAEVPTAQNPLAEVFNSFPFIEDGPFDLPSRRDVCAARKSLAMFDPDAPIRPQAKGNIVLDGVVLEARVLPKQKQEILLEVQTVLFGNENHVPEQLTIISPMERYGGLPIAIGEQYRVFVFPLNGKYYSWAATGSAPTDHVFSGFYKCADKQRRISATKP